MDEKYKLLIKELRKDGRKKLTEVAKVTKIPVSTLFDMMHRLETKGLVGHKMLVNFEKIGFTMRTMIALKVDYDERKKLQEFLSKHKYINNLYEINDGYDYLVEGIFQNPKEMYDFIGEIEEKHSIITKSVHNIIRTISSEKFLTDDEHFR
ncbi:MAG: Lrp/AsnC family transcriptional regulator [Candidatus Woesearchaeota archaeon]|jgi:DNA-binding Lrp family transcriptional regulator|nr:Lrp/AsnC family transcriptional regulator [Candidatus Woesearchaeota archaeon]